MATRAEIQQRYRRRRALGAVSCRIDLPSDVAEFLRHRGIDIADPKKLGLLMAAMVEEDGMPEI